MAEMNQSQGGNSRRGQGRRMRGSTRIDMTAMVDVAFLLLTFFVLTATMTETNSMDLTVPPPCHEGDCGADVPEERVLTVVLDRDKVYTWWKVTDPVVDSFPADSLRSRLTAHLKRHAPACPPGATPKEMKASGCWQPLFVVKPRTRSRYKLLVDCLDELSIIGAKHYALGSWTVQDSLMLKGNASLQASNQRIVTH